MPRPQLAVGDYGNISTSKQPNGIWVALARFRDEDGGTRRVKAQGTSRSAAEAALKAKFKTRITHGTGTEINAESLITDLAKRYLRMKEQEDLAPNTLYNIRRTIEKVITPKLGKLRIREATPQRLHAAINEVAADRGPGSALMFRTNLSGMFSTAALWGAVPSNPVSFTPRPKMVKKAIRALSIDELLVMRAHMVEALRPFTYEERLARANGDKGRMGGKNRSQTPLDVMDFMLATGCRAAEAPGLAWVDAHLDDPVPWVEIRQQVVRVQGEGLRLTPTKERDERRLRLPGFAVAMLRRRQATAVGPMVFPSDRNGSLRAPRNIAMQWEKAFAGSEWEWVTPKVLRKTVATLVEAEHGSALAAKQLGHASDAVTRRHYIAPSMVPIDAGSVLDVLVPYVTETGHFAETVDSEVQEAS